MRTILCVSLIVSSMLWGAGPTPGQSPVGALAIDERRSDQWGWAADHETASAAQNAALRECGAGCSSGGGVAASATPATSSVQRPGVPPAETAEQENLGWQVISVQPLGVPPAETAEQENLFWQVIVTPASTSVQRAGVPPPAPGAHVPARRNRTGGADTASGSVAGDERPTPVEVFRDCADCPEMVVLRAGRLALGRYEVTVGEYRTFASATGREPGECWVNSWKDPGFPQTDRHPVTCVSWDDAQEYVSWLSRTTGATYRLPTEEEWSRAAAGSQPGCGWEQSGGRGTCPVGSYGANGAGLSDMVGNVWEWTADCWEGDCGRRVLRGGSWLNFPVDLRPGARLGDRAGDRFAIFGFRVARMFD